MRRPLPRTIDVEGPDQRIDAKGVANWNSVVANYAAIFSDADSVKRPLRRMERLWQLLRRMMHLQLSAAPIPFDPVTSLRRDKRDLGKITWQSELGDTYEIIGDALLARGRTVEALETYQRFFAIAEELAERDPDIRDRRLAVVVSNWKLALLGDNAARRFCDIVTDLRMLNEQNMLNREQLAWLPEAEKKCGQLVTPSCGQIAGSDRGSESDTEPDRTLVLRHLMSRSDIRSSKCKP